MNLGGEQIVVYSNECSNCEDSDNLGINYMNITDYISQNKTSIGMPDNILDGYGFDASLVQAPFCLNNSKGDAFFCSYDNVDVYAVTKISENKWSYKARSASGLIGINNKSPIW